jgi:D-sedoheptulose 7-phosphate isomerase
MPNPTPPNGTPHPMPHAPSHDVPVWMRDRLREHIRVAEAMFALLPAVHSTATLLCAAFERGNVLFTFGGGGSAADAKHLAGAIIGHHSGERRPLGAVALTADAGATNGPRPDDVFARQVSGLARPGDIVAAFTTDGRSPEIVAALLAAQERGATTVLFGGSDGGPAARYADVALLAPSTTGPNVRQTHSFMLHTIGESVDAWAAGDEVHR